MANIISLLFGASWKSSLIGLASGLILAATAYAQARPEPGWYVIAAGLVFLGRVVKDADKSNSQDPGPAQKVG